MRLPRNVALLGRRLVFLDTADWSYLEAGQDHKAGEKLRALGESGDATFVVTMDHLVEAVGLRTGLRHRLAFMRAFPGTVLFHFGGAQLLRLAVLELAAMLVQSGESEHEFRCQSLSDHSLDELESITKGLRGLRWAVDLSAFATARAAPVGVKLPPAQRATDAKIHRLAREGDRFALADYLRRTTGGGSSARVIQRLASRGLVALYAFALRRGLISEAAGGDLLFDQLVTAALPTEFAANDELMRGMKSLWSDPDLLAFSSTSLACVKDIEEARTPTRDRAKIRSTYVDRHHACFAPLMDVFTCDKRIHRIVERAVGRSESSVAVVRTRSLARVAALLS